MKNIDSLQEMVEVYKGLSEEQKLSVMCYLFGAVGQLERELDVKQKNRYVNLAFENAIKK